MMVTGGATVISSARHKQGMGHKRYCRGHLVMDPAGRTTITPSTVTGQQDAPSPPRLKKAAVALLLGVVLVGAAPCRCLEALCPPDNVVDMRDGYYHCECAKELVRSGVEVTIRCDFQGTEDVLLTENLYAFQESKAMSASVRIANATSVTVTEGFLGSWLRVFSVGLDLWNCGTVSLVTAPTLYLHPHPPFTTFAGIGLVGCQVPEVPAGLLQDRVSASLLIKNSVVGVVRRGFFKRVRKVRYIVLEDSVVDEVEGSLAAEGYVSLNPLNVHRWNGLVISNTTIHELGNGAFNVTHKAMGRHESTHKVVMQGSRVDHVSSGGISVWGDIAVTIKGNTFGTLDDDALRVNISRDFKLEGNVIAAAAEGALRGLHCNSLTELETNTIHVITKTSATELFHSPFTPFPPSCRSSQVFSVVNQAMPQPYTAVSHTTWVLLALLLVLMLAVCVVLWWWRENNRKQNITSNSFQSSNGITSSARYQANHQEVNMVHDVVPSQLYDRTAL